ncbi:hypothetical protein LT85_0340 [Collimonas arenae]|uniref:Uncharacterized protein n=1 Tax=Collimonas arenae TaxID=279058 RepID=A0A0A1F6R7_9BURK|nr:hypothetical protein LT85_0340 [Collimonas arenae]
MSAAMPMTAMGEEAKLLGASSGLGCDWLMSISDSLYQ